jgi:MFS family permease
MAVGRLGAAIVIGRFGNRRTLQGAGLLAAGGMALALATREPLLVIAGFLVVGLALSAVVPIAFSAAGDIAPERAGAAISVVTTLGYGGFLLGPVIVGGLAEVIGLRAALGIIAVSGLMIFILALRLKAT